MEDRIFVRDHSGGEHQIFYLFFHLHLDMKLGQLYLISLHIYETALRPFIIIASSEAWRP